MVGMSLQRKSHQDVFIAGLSCEIDARHGCLSGISEPSQALRGLANGALYHLEKTKEAFHCI